MASREPDKGLADYLAILISPLLVMIAVGTLVFFLKEIAYTGSYDDRLTWSLFWFVVGAVLVIRLSVREGKEYASLFGLPLAGAIALFMLQMVEAGIWILFLLAAVWWMASKLVWDTTLPEEKGEDEDVSGQGLLTAALETPEPSATGEANSTRDQKRRVRYRRHSATIGTRSRPEDPAQKPHPPGLWIVYFSLMALLVFGLGQASILEGDSALRRYGFQLLLVHVAAMLCLLWITSFLGLRRYLRRRRLQMPGRVVQRWAVTGMLLIVSMLLFCLLLPRPHVGFSAEKLLSRVGSPEQQASEHSATRGSATERRDGNRNIQDSGDRRKGTGQKQATSEGGEGKRRGSGKGTSSGGSQYDSAKVGDAGAPGDKGAQGRSRSGSQDASQQSGSAFNEAPSVTQWMQWLQWLFWLVLALGFIYLGVRERARIWKAIQNALARWREQIRRLFRRRARGPSGVEGAGASEGPTRGRRFADFADPFSTGMADHEDARRLVRYTFEALEAWAAEQGVTRSAEQTPLEFAQSLAAHFPFLEAEASQIGRLYSYVAYTDADPPSQSRASIRKLWQQLGSADK